MSFVNNFLRLKAKLISDIAELSKTPREINQDQYFAYLVNKLIDYQILMLRSFIGVKETGSNMGEEVNLFQRETRSIGLAWCASFVIYVVNEGISDSLGLSSILPKTPSSQNLYEWAKKFGFLTNQPKAGDIGIWRNGKTWTGHVTPVAGVNPFKKTLSTVEGNTNTIGGREGDGVYERTRSYRKFGEVSKGLWLRGFIDMEKVYMTYLKNMSEVARAFVKFQEALSGSGKQDTSRTV